MAAAASGSGAALPTGTLTFCFTDIEASTQLWEQYPQAMPAALARPEQIFQLVSPDLPSALPPLRTLPTTR